MIQVRLALPPLGSFCWRSSAQQGLVCHRLSTWVCLWQRVHQAEQFPSDPGARRQVLTKPFRHVWFPVTILITLRATSCSFPLTRQGHWLTSVTLLKTTAGRGGCGRVARAPATRSAAALNALLTQWRTFKFNNNSQITNLGFGVRLWLASSWATC